MSVELEIKNRIANLISAANAKTGGAETDLTSAVSALVSGFGQGGGEDTLTAMLTNTLTEYSNDSVTKVPAYAFFGCTSLQKVDLASNTEVGEYAFEGCSNLETANLSATKKIGNHAFAYSRLKEAIFPLVTNSGYSWFSGATALTRAVFPSSTAAGPWMFDGCTSLIYADFGKATAIGYSQTFNKTALTALVIRSETMATNAIDSLGGTPIGQGTGYIYVPSALLESYKAATNWSTYADQFRALEDYTVDGTTTGELDESKI